ncbi:hypothetical protein Tdes44962_MAKER08978, partial [Teratosphaeria destructans]
MPRSARSSSWGWRWRVWRLWGRWGWSGGVSRRRRGCGARRRRRGRTRWLGEVRLRSGC